MGTSDPLQPDVPTYPDDQYDPTYTGALPLVHGHPRRRTKDVPQPSELGLSHFDEPSEIELFAKQRCPLVPAARRSVCPLLGRIRAIEPTANGAVVVVEGDAETLLDHMRCHQQFGAARAAHDMANMPDCPLFLPGLELKAPQGDRIEFRLTDVSQLPELLRRLRAHQESHRAAP